MDISLINEHIKTIFFISTNLELEGLRQRYVMTGKESINIAIEIHRNIILEKALLHVKDKGLDKEIEAFITSLK